MVVAGDPHGLGHWCEGGFGHGCRQPHQCRAGALQLTHRRELEGVQGRLQRLDLGNELHQLAALVGRPQRLGQLDRSSAHAGHLGDEAAGVARHA